MGSALDLWRPFDAKNIMDPYAMYARLRQEDPVHQSQTGEWIITKYTDARNILRDDRFTTGNRIAWLEKSIRESGRKNFDFSAIHRVLHAFILFLNGSDHSRIRAFIQGAWDNRSVEKVIQSNLDTLLQTFSGDVDLIRDLARPLPAMTIGKILGLLEADYSYLRSLGSVLIKSLDLYISLKDILRINEAATGFLEYFEKIIHGDAPLAADGLITRLIDQNRDSKILSDEELLSSCILLFIAGEETSVSLIGTGLMHVLADAGVSNQLKNTPTGYALAVEELIRFDSPVQIVGRYASEDCTIGGRNVSAGDTLTICLGSANRDPEQFEHPDEFDIQRSPKRHLGFGGGAHYCIGDWLARIQTRMTIQAMLKEFDLMLVDESPAWNNNLAIRSLSHLNCRLDNRPV